MGQRTPTIDTSQLLQSRPFQFAFSVLTGVAAFFLASWLLVNAVERPETSSTPVTTGPALDSLGPRVPADKVAISTPLFGAPSLLGEVQVGDRMDIIALFPPSPGLSMRSAVIVRGATVIVRPNVSAGAPIVFAVTPEESLVVAHLVQSGASLAYSLWPEGGAPAVEEPMDLAQVRARLGIAQATATATPPPTAIPSPTADNTAPPPEEVP